MSSIKKRHFVVLGGGLAGTFLAARLLEYGQEVSLIDDRDPRSASRVSAGLYNVITGRYGAKTWMAEKLLGGLHTTLDQHPYALFKPYLHPQLIYRPFREYADYNKWMGRTADPNFSTLFRLEQQALLKERLHNELGGISILPCGWLEVEPFILAMQQWLSTMGGLNLLPYRLDYTQIDIEHQKIYTDEGMLEFDDLIFAEGFWAFQNPWFKHVEIIPNKGNLIHIYAPELKLPFVLSKKVYCIPIEGDQYVVGATYKRDIIDPSPDEEGRKEICFHLEKAIKVPYQIIHHWAGIRPTTKDRKPIIGTHPTFPHLHIFNGMGTKGVLQAPYFSDLFSKQLLAGKERIVPKEASSERFAN